MKRLIALLFFTASTMAWATTSQVYVDLLDSRSSFDVQMKPETTDTNTVEFLVYTNRTAFDVSSYVPIVYASNDKNFSRNVIEIVGTSSSNVATFTTADVTIMKSHNDSYVRFVLASETLPRTVYYELNGWLTVSDKIVSVTGDPVLIAHSPLTTTNTFISTEGTNTVIILNGIIQSWTITMTEGDVSYDLPLPVYYAPDTNFPAWFASLGFELTGTTADAGAPEIFNSSKSATSLDAVTLTGTNLNTTYKLVGRSFVGNSVAAGTNVFDSAAVLQVPSEMGVEYALLWATNSSGYSTPVALNKAEATWAGPKTANTNETFSIYGRNLTCGSATSSVYCVEEDEWLTSTSANPYRADFTVPASWAAGTYTLYAHNGSGAQYGFSDPVSLSVVHDVGWTGTLFNVVSDFGATGDGVTDDTVAVSNAIVTANAVNNSRLYFPAGTYLVNQSFHGVGDILVYGDGTNSIITLADTYGWRGGSYDFGLFYEWNRYELRDLCIRSATNQTEASVTYLVGSNNKSGPIKLTRVKFDQLPWSWSSGGAIVGYSGCSDVTIEDCMFDVAGYIDLSSTDHATISGCTIRGIRDCGFAINAGSATHLTFTDNDISNYDTGDDEGWLQGRVLFGACGSGGADELYVAGNTTHDLMVRPAWSNQNTGEQFMFEFGQTVYECHPVSATISNIVVDGLDDDFAGMTLSVFSGNGSGQSASISGYDPDTGIVTVSTTLTNLNTYNWTVGPTIVRIDDVYAGYITQVDGSGGESVDGTALKLDNLPESNWTGETVYIESGRGFGQYRKIVSCTDGVLTVTPPFAAAPDASSHIQIGYYLRNHVYFDNVLDGQDPTQSTASTGISAFGSGFGYCIQSNTFTDVSTGSILWPMYDAGFNAACAFNEISDNTYSNCLAGVVLQYNDWGSDSLSDGVVLAGNRIARNTFLSGGSYDVRLKKEYSFGNQGLFGLSLITDNTTDGAASSTVSYYPDAATVGTNQVFIGNSWK